MTKLENVLVWLYVKTWGKFGDHVIAEKGLWNFTANDLETALISLAYPRKKKKSERVQALTDLIMGKFEQGGLAAFREWSGELHEQIIETLPESVELEVTKTVTNSPRQQLHREPVKIVKWDPGNYLKLRYLSKMYIIYILLKYVELNFKSFYVFFKQRHSMQM